MGTVSIQCSDEKKVFSPCQSSHGTEIQVNLKAKKKSNFEKNSCTTGFNSNSVLPPLLNSRSLFSQAIRQYIFSAKQVNRWKKFSKCSRVVEKYSPLLNYNYGLSFLFVNLVFVASNLFVFAVVLLMYFNVHVCVCPNVSACVSTARL